MAWTLFLARAGGRAARDTAREFAEGDSVIDHLFRLIMTIGLVIVAPILIVLELTRRAVTSVVGEPVTTLNAAQVLVCTLVVVAGAVVVLRSRRRARGARAVRSASSTGTDAPYGPALTYSETAVLHHIRAAADVDAAVRAQDFAVRRALSRQGHIAYDIPTTRWYLR